MNAATREIVEQALGNKEFMRRRWQADLDEHRKGVAAAEEMIAALDREIAELRADLPVEREPEDPYPGAHWFWAGKAHLVSWVDRMSALCGLRTAFGSPFEAVTGPIDRPVCKNCAKAEAGGMVVLGTF